MVTAVFILCVEHTSLSSLWKVRLQSHPPACIFPAAHTDYFADTTMSKRPGFHLYVPLIYFEILKKTPALFFIYRSSAVLKLARVRTSTRSGTTLPCYKAQKRSFRIRLSVSCQRREANPRDPPSDLLAVPGDENICTPQIPC